MIAATGTQTASVTEQIVGSVVIAALCILGYLGWRRLRAVFGRLAANARAAAAALRGSLLEGSDADAIAAGRPTAGLAAIRVHDPGFDEHDFLAGVESQFVRLTCAIAEQSPGKLRPLVADGLFGVYSRSLTSPRASRSRLSADRVQFTDVRIVGAHSDARYDTITVRMAAIITRSGVDRKGRVRHSSAVDLTDLVLQRSSSAVRPQAGGLFAQRCPHCQAPLDVDLEGCCTHCHTDVMGGAFDWVITRHDAPGAGVGPPPSEQELLGIRAAVAGAAPAAPGSLAAQLQLAETVAVNETGRLTHQQHRIAVAAARHALRDAFGELIVSAFRVAFCAAAAILLARLMLQKDDPWLRTITVGGRTMTLPLLHLLPVALGVLVAVLLVRAIITSAIRFRRWIRAHGGAHSADGRVTFAAGAYRVRCDMVGRDLVPLQAGDTAIAGIAPGPCRVFLGPGQELLSLRLTGDPPTMLAALQEALCVAMATTAATLEQLRRQVAGGDPSVAAIEGYVTAHPGPEAGRGRFVLHGRELPVAAAAVAALVEGVWYRAYLRPADGAVLAVEPLPAERATSTAVDPGATTGGIAAIRAHDPAFDESTFLERVSRTFAAVQNAWCRLDPSVSRGVMSDTLWRAHARQIQDRRARGSRPALEGLSLTGVAIRSAESTAQWDTIVARIAASAAEYDVEADAGGHSRIVRGDRQVRPWQEDWVFHRAATATTPAQGGTLAQRCPHCQAPIQLDELGVCAWCHLPVMTGAVDWVVTRIDRVGAAPPAGASSGPPASDARRPH